MPESETTHLRIFCICGQKMKMSEKMFGLPGKCVACRQKIRIPRKDELAEGEDTIYLKDRPEFLRDSDEDSGKAGSEAVSASSNPVKLRRGADAPEEESEGGGTAVAVAETPAADLDVDADAVVTVALEVLEPLRNICSIRYKLQKQYETLDKVSTKDSGNRAELKGRIARVRATRNDLDEQLRQVLMEVAIELSSTDDKIVQAGLSTRVGEIGFDEYRETVDRLRRRRDRLERRQHNLRGWLATRDPHMAGGYIDLSLDALPEVGFNVTLPVDPEDSGPLFQAHINQLKSAFLARSHAERKLAEMDRMTRSDAKRKKGFAEARADAKAEAKMANEAIAFERSRLEQLIRDFDDDTETYDAQLELTRGRLQVGEIDRTKFDAIEAVMLRAKTDAAKARAIIKRTLNANSAQDVPEPRGTFLSRLKAERAEQAVGVDQWIVWGAAIFVAVSIFLPVAAKFSLVELFLEFDHVNEPIRWYFLGLVGYAAIVAAAGSLVAAIRGRALLLIWLLGTIAGTYAIHETNYALDPISTLFRAENLWYLQPGMFVLLAAHLAILAATALCLVSFNQQPLLFGGGVLAGAIVIVAISSDLFGALQAEPAVSVSEGATALSEGETEQSRIVTITNQGRRTLHLVPRPSTAKAAYLFLVERNLGATSWMEVPIAGGPADRIAAPSSANLLQPSYTIPAGVSIDVVVELMPGRYRVLLRDAEGVEDATSFEVVAPPPMPRETPPINPPEEQPLPEDPTDEPAPPQRLDGPVDVKLSGVLTAEGREPRFSFVLVHGDGTEEKATVAIGGAVVGPWNLIEYNPSLNTATLSDGADILIVRTGERVVLPR